MQTLSEIRGILSAAGIRPRRHLGQCFLIDLNLMRKLLDLAGLDDAETVLEVGPGTGSLTAELLDRARRVVAVEIDARLADEVARLLGDRANLTLVRGDVLAGKRAISPEVLAAVGCRAHLVANLPYGVATPLVAQCLLGSWRARRGDASACRFDRLTFTVQREVADRLAAPPGGKDYGPISVVTALLGRTTLGPAVPAAAFWPRPKVGGRIMRIDFDARAADAVADADELRAVLALAFLHRRKRIGSILRRPQAKHPPQRLADALAAAGIDPSVRPEQVPPEQYRNLGNALAGRPGA